MKRGTLAAVLALACNETKEPGPPPADDPEPCEAVIYFDDLDGDGYGALAPAGEACEIGPGQVTTSGDCDDTDPNATPSDLDGDGVTGCDNDCDDADPYIGPFDNDGDGATGCEGDCDDRDPGANADDLDEDGYSNCQGDCDDQRPEWSPENGCVSPESALKISGSSLETAIWSNVAALDFDGDGSLELFVQTAQSPSPNEGAHGVALFTGPWTEDRPSTERQALWHGIHTWDDVGYDMVSMGDLDGDGLQDLGVTRPLGGDEQPDGYLHLLYGSDTPPAGEIPISTLPGWQLLADAPFNYYDRPDPTPLGDLDGDGFADYALAHDTARAGEDEVGEVYIVYGDGTRKTDMSSVTELDIAWTSLVGQRIGAEMAAADLDGDGMQDLVLGSTWWFEPGAKSGRAYISYGTGERVVGAIAEQDADATLHATYWYGGFASDLDAGPDLDGDGYPDLLAQEGTTSEAGEGSLWVYRGGAERMEGDRAGDEAAWLGIHGRGGDDYFGSPFAAGDLDGDWELDLAVGAPWHQDRSGIVYVFRGPFAAGDLAYDDAAAFIPAPPEAFLGGGLVVADLDGSGGDDLVVTASGWGDGQVLIFRDGTF